MVSFSLQSLTFLGVGNFTRFVPFVDSEWCGIETSCLMMIMMMMIMIMRMKMMTMMMMMMMTTKTTITTKMKKTELFSFFFCKKKAWFLDNLRFVEILYIYLFFWYWCYYPYTLKGWFVFCVHDFYWAFLLSLALEIRLWNFASQKFEVCWHSSWTYSKVEIPT